MKKKLTILLTICFLLTAVFAGCGSESLLDPDNPVTIEMWHNYGGQMKETMDVLVDEFNTTVGKEAGIIVSVTSISSSAVLDEKLTMAANGDPGAPELPNLTTLYPKTAMSLLQNDMIVDLGTMFTQEELSSYVASFVEEGRLTDGNLYVFPVAKSTEVLFLNKTLFDRFSADTGVTVADLSTFEGIAGAAELYYDWSGGKMFYTADSWFNFAQIGMEQLGSRLIADGRIMAQ